MARKSRKHLQDQEPSPRRITPVEPTYVAGIYARVSSGDHPDSSIENQITIAKAFLENQTNIELHKVYIDRGVSSFALIRPAFAEMLHDMETKTINCIIVKDMTRLTRRFLEAGELLQIRFPSWGMRFISITDNFDSILSDATAPIIPLRSLIAYEYSKELSRKITSVFRVRQQSGTYTPPRLPYGYEKRRIGKQVEWKQDSGTSTIVRGIFEAALHGESSYTIARQLNSNSTPTPGGGLWTPRSVLRILRNDSYVGVFTTGKTHNKIVEHSETIPVEPDAWIRHPHHHEPIVDELTFDRVQAKFNGRAVRRPASVPERDIFGGKIYCGICGRKMKRKKAGNGSLYYICPLKDEANACSSPAISIEKIKRQVYQQISDHIQEAKCYRENMLVFEKTPYFIRREREQLEKIDTMNAQIAYCQSLYKAALENIDDPEGHHSNDHRGFAKYLSTAIFDCRNEIAEIEGRRKRYWESESSRAPWLQDILSFTETERLTTELVSALVDRICVTNGNIASAFVNEEHRPSK